jgi:hypothetical protein
MNEVDQVRRKVQRYPEVQIRDLAGPWEYKPHPRQTEGKLSVTNLPFRVS